MKTKKSKKVKKFGAFIVFIGLISLIYGISYVKKINNTKQLERELPLVGQEHYFDTMNQQSLETITRMKPSSKKNLTFFNQLLKTYFVYDSFKMIEISYEIITNDGTKTEIQEAIDKKEQSYLVKEKNNKGSLLKVFEQRSFYYIDQEAQKYVKEELGTKEDEFKSNLSNYGFDLTFSEYVVMLMAVIERNNDFKANIKNGEYVMTGKIDDSQSEALQGDFEFISDQQTGIVKKLSFVSNNKILYQANCLSVDMSSNNSNQASLLPDLSNYEKTTMDKLVK